MSAPVRVLRSCYPPADVLQEEADDEGRVGMRHGLRQMKRRSDAGMTLPEVLIALVILAIVSAALLSSLLVSVRVASAGQTRTVATQLAADQVEQQLALPYASLGFFANDAGYQGTVAGETTVNLGATRTVGSKAPMPQGAAQTVNGTAYTVTRSITWAADTSAGASSDGSGYGYKRVRVTVTWSGPGAKTTTQEALRSPTVAEVTPPVGGAAATPTPSPSPSPGAVAFVGQPAVSPGQPLNGTGGLTQAMTLNAQTTSAPSQPVSLTYTNKSGTAVTVLLTGTVGNTTWNGTIAVGGGPFTPGTNTFTFRATSSSGAVTTSVVTVLLTAPQAQPVDILPPVIAPPLCRGTDNRLLQGSTVTADVMNVVSTDLVQINGDGGGTTRMTYVGVNANGSLRFSIPIPTGYPFVTTQLTLFASRTSDAAGAQESFAVTVATVAKKQSCP